MQGAITLMIQIRPRGTLSFGWSFLLSIGFVVVVVALAAAVESFFDRIERRDDRDRDTKPDNLPGDP